MDEPQNEMRHTVGIDLYKQVRLEGGAILVMSLRFDDGTKVSADIPPELAFALKCMLDKAECKSPELFDEEGDFTLIEGDVE